MNKFVIFSFSMIVLGIVFFLLPNISVLTFEDVEPEHDSVIYVGLGETCVAYNLKFTCEEGLECVIKKYEQFETGICLEPGTSIEDYELNKVIDREDPIIEDIPRNPANERDDKIVNLNSTGLDVNN